MMFCNKNGVTDNYIHLKSNTKKSTMLTSCITGKLDCYGLFPPMETETETDSHMDYCTKQVFPLVQRWIPIPLLKYSKIGTEICP